MTAMDLKNLLTQTAIKAMASPPADEEASRLQSLIGMVSTLVADGKLSDLTVLLAVSFPAYYTTPPPLTGYPPINAN